MPFAVWANGGIHYSIEAPQSEDEISIPHQRAIIFWDNNEKKEVMLLSTEIEAEGISDLAWVIPIESRVKPEVEEAETEIFDAVPWLFSEIKRVKNGGGILVIGIFILLVLTLFFCLFRKKRTKLYLISGVIFIVIIILFVSIIFISMGGAHGGSSSKIIPIEIIEIKKVGIYDVMILKSTDANFMVNWLNENGYKVSTKSNTILQEYCNKSDFYFIVNKINEKYLDEKNLSQGLATPLEIKFQPEKPFYPMKLSSINGGETLIDVYFFSSEPVGDESGLLKVKKSRNIQKFGQVISLSRNEDAKKSYDYLQNWQWQGDMDYPTFLIIGTWLQFKGDLSELQKDSYFSFEALNCDDLPDEESDWSGFEITLSKCYEMFAKKRNDISFCEKITDSSVKGDCYKYFAISNKNPSLCEKISNKDQRYSCFIDFSDGVKNLSVCEDKMPSQYSKDICIRVFAVNANDDLLCEKIIDKGEKDHCYSRISDRTKDPSICDKIIDESKKDGCYWDIVFDGSQDIFLCEKMSGKNWYKDSCYSYIAKNTRDISICDKISDKGEKEECYQGVAIEMQNFVLCEKITDRYINDMCYWNIARAVKDISICEKITTQWRKENCLRQLSN
jgi:hypothetical protein